MEINHLFKLYHGVAVNPPDYRPRASSMLSENSLTCMTVGGRIVHERAFA